MPRQGVSKRSLVAARIFPHRCDICGFGCKTAGGLKRHIVIHDDGTNRGRNAQAEVCTPFNCASA